jgi:hypothetical protein
MVSEETLLLLVGLLTHDSGNSSGSDTGCRLVRLDAVQQKNPQKESGRYHGTCECERRTFRGRPFDQCQKLLKEG